MVRSKYAFFMLLLYFFFLALYGKSFAYLHADLGPVPVYVSDLALGIVLMRIILIGSVSAFTRRFRTVLLPLSCFLGWGLFRLAVSHFQYGNQFGAVQTLRDFALCYQAMWVLFGLTLTGKEWVWFASSFLLGSGISHILQWLLTLYFGFGHVLPGFGDIPGNEVVSALFPLSFAVWEPVWAGIFVSFYGYALIGQLLIYLKKNWMGSVLVVMAPAAANTRDQFGKLLRKKRWYCFSFCTFIGILLAITSLEISTRAEFNHVIIQAIRDHLHNPSMWLFHGELNLDQSGRLLTFIAWRKHLWRQAWDGFLSSPWFGHGFGPHVVQTVLYGGPAINDGRWISGPHNSFLTVLFRLGVVGALPLAWLMFCAFRSWLKGRKSARWSDVSFGCFVSVVGFAYFNVCLENPHSGIWFWVFLGAVFSLASSQKGDTKFNPVGS